MVVDDRQQQHRHRLPGTLSIDLTAKTLTNTGTVKVGGTDKFLNSESVSNTSLPARSTLRAR